MFELTANEDGSSTLAFKADPDFESPGDANRDNVYEVAVVATDGNRKTAMKQVTVKVTNVEEAGKVTLPGAQPQVGTPMTATLTDSDIVSADSVTWQWQRSADGTATGTWTGIDDATSASYTPALTNDEEITDQGQVPAGCGDIFGYDLRWRSRGPQTTAGIDSRR